jgi:hypothetical protein
MGEIMNLTVRCLAFSLVMIVIIITLLLFTTSTNGAIRESRMMRDLPFEHPVRHTAAELYLGQKPDEQTGRPLGQWPMECEGAAMRLDTAVIDTKKMDGAYLIIIARLGTGEPQGLNQIRLAVVEEYVLRRGSDLRYVFGEGKRLKGLGRLEVYVGGRLADIMPFKKNSKGHCQ